MTSTTVDLDPRIHAYRDDIADIALADRIALPHYVAPVARRIGLSVANLHADPSETSELGSQLLYGEGFALLDTVDGWAWGYGLHDHFVGFVRKDALIPDGEATHIVSAISTSLALAQADNAPSTLFMGSRVAGTAEGDCLMTETGSIALADARAIDEAASDPVAIAEMLIDTPYLLGGRSANGIDCSGLVQLSLGMAGHRVQRDSDLQQASAGDILPDGAELRRGDLVFFPEHVGLMVDSETLIHASGHNGKTCTEPLADVIARIAEKHDEPVLARRRIAG
ncbi:C40 family peptidase [Parasphingopyxis algicola]|nr:C40 family peptidase [Parasphingopyxis algicola]